MTGKLPDQNQKNLFLPLLKEFINMRHELAISNQEMRADRANCALWAGCELLIFRKIQDEVYSAS
jgi:hypothetical protein